MSAHGISPTWRQRNEFANGAPWFFDPTVIHVIFLTCELDLVGDISITHNVGLTCEIIEPPPNFTHDIVLTCDIDLNGILNPIHVVNLGCTLVAVDP